MVHIQGNAAPKRKLGPFFFLKFTFLQGELPNG